MKKLKTKKDGIQEEKEKEERKDKVNKQGISVERRTPCITRVCWQCKAMYVSENPNNYKVCRCGKQTIEVDINNFELMCPQYGGKV